MIYVTGDTHGPVKLGYRSLDGIGQRLSKDNLRSKNMPALTSDDFVIICGDFGCIWEYDSRYDPDRSLSRDVVLLDHGESKEEKYWLDWLQDKPYTILFCDGNHENFDRLANAYPEVEYLGGHAHKIRDNVYHLMRGYVFDIGGKSFFVMGGARSHDVKDGILHPHDFSSNRQMKEMIRKLNRNGALYRIEHVSWWEEELPSSSELKMGALNLTEHGNTVDYIITHCAPQHVAEYLGYNEPDECTLFLESVAAEVDFKGWFFGHYHENREVGQKYHMLYDSVVRIE